MLYKIRMGKNAKEIPMMTIGMSLFMTCLSINGVNKVQFILHLLQKEVLLPLIYLYNKQLQFTLCINQYSFICIVTC